MWLLAAGAREIDPAQGFHFTQAALVMQAAINGQGLALGTTSPVADELLAGRLVRPFHLSLKGPPQFAFYLVAPRATADRPLVKAFREWVLAEVALSSHCRQVPLVLGGRDSRVEPVPFALADGVEKPAEL